VAFSTSNEMQKKLENSENKRCEKRDGKDKVKKKKTDQKRKM
jgi:hypothetical protein